MNPGGFKNVSSIAQEMFSSKSDRQEQLSLALEYWDGLSIYWDVLAHIALHFLSAITHWPVDCMLIRRTANKQAELAKFPKT